VTEQDFIDAVQAHMDDTARARGYDSILSATTYEGSKVDRFSKEGKAAREWRDDCWAFGLQALDDFQKSKRGIPTQQELIKELPPMTWGD
jgi:hypothetical protein